MKNTDGKQRFAKSLQAIGLAVVFFLVVSPGRSLGKTAVGSKHSAVPPPAAAIAPEEVAARSSEVTNLVITFFEKFTVSPEIEKIQQALPEINKQIDLDAAETAATAGTQPSLAILEVQRALWQRWQLQVSTWLTLLTQRAVELRRDLDRLAQMKATWTRTRDVAQAGQSPEVILQQIEATLASIEAAQLPLKAREEAVLGLQADMAAKQARCDEMLAQILKARKSAVQGIAARESLPFWSPELWGHARTALPHRLGVIVRGFQTSFREYIRDPSRGLPLHAALLLVSTMTACAARRKKRQWKDSGVGVSPIVKVFDHPYSAALILVLLVATAVNSPAPARVKDVLAALALLPMIRLVRAVIDPRLVPAVRTAAILYAVDLVRQTFGGTPLVEQALLIVESLAAIVMLGWLLHSGRLGSDSEQKPEGLRARFLPPLAKLLMFSFAIGCLAATLGFTRLARLITPATLSGGVLALSLYAYVRVGGGAAVIGLQSWLLQRLQMVRNHGDRIQW